METSASLVRNYNARAAKGELESYSFFTIIPWELKNTCFFRTPTLILALTPPHCSFLALASKGILHREIKCCPAQEYVAYEAGQGVQAIETVVFR